MYLPSLIHCSQCHAHYVGRGLPIYYMVLAKFNEGSFMDDQAGEGAGTLDRTIYGLVRADLRARNGTLGCAGT